MTTGARPERGWMRPGLLVLAVACAMALPAACARGRPDGAVQARLTVFAAASLTRAFESIGAEFEASHPGTQVDFNFGGSQTLRTQLEHGAVADVYASASPEEMQAVVEAGLAGPAAGQAFALNRLVVVLPAGNPAGVSSLRDLAHPGLKLVLGAEVVPVGHYAREALRRMEASFGPGFAAAVLDNVVSEEDNVRQVVAKVQLGEADAGLAYASDAAAQPALERLDIPAEYNVTAVYHIAALTAAPQPGLAAEFIALVLSAEGQAALAGWGFTPAAP